jgi:hypothetical protein
MQNLESIINSELVKKYFSFTEFIPSSDTFPNEGLEKSMREDLIFFPHKLNTNIIKPNYRNNLYLVISKKDLTIKFVPVKNEYDDLALSWVRQKTSYKFDDLENDDMIVLTSKMNFEKYSEFMGFDKANVVTV